MTTPVIRESLGGYGTGTSNQFNLGSSTAVGDLLIVIHCQVATDIVNLVTPTGAGWTERSNSFSNTFRPSGRVWTKVVDTAGSQIVETNNTSARTTTTVIYVLSNTGDIDVISSTAEGATNQVNIIAPSIDPVEVDDLFITTYIVREDNTFSSTPSGMTVDQNIDTIGLSGNNSMNTLATSQVLTSGGLTGTRTAVCSVDSRGYATFSIAVKGQLSTTVVNKELKFNWHLNSSINDELELIWNVETNTTIINKDLKLVWNLNSLINDDLELIWNNLTLINDDIKLIWNDLTLINNNLKLAWHLNNLTNNELKLAWDIEVSTTVVNKDLKLVWHLKAQVSNDLSIKWHVAFDSSQTWTPIPTVISTWDTAINIASTWDKIELDQVVWADKPASEVTAWESL